jgi:hypothetical protein
MRPVAGSFTPTRQGRRQGADTNEIIHAGSAPGVGDFARDGS